MPTWLVTAYNVLKFAWKYRDSIKNAIEPEDPGTPLTFKDVEHQREQMRAATTPLKK